MSDSDDEIYDDGMSITNRVALKSIREKFEQHGDVIMLGGPKPGLAPKPPSKPGGPRKFEPKRFTPNGFPAVPGKASDTNNNASDSKPNLPPALGPKRNSQINIPGAFMQAEAATAPPKTSPKPLSKPGVSPKNKFGYAGLNNFSKTSPPLAEFGMDFNKNKGETSPRSDSAVPETTKKIPKVLQKFPMAIVDADESVINSARLGLKHVDPKSPGVQEHAVPLRVKDGKLDGVPVMRKSIMRKTTVKTRNLDGQKFRLIDPSAMFVPAGKAPSKPPKLEDVDLQSIISQYNAALFGDQSIVIRTKPDNHPSSKGVEVEEETEEIYEDIGGPEEEEGPRRSAVISIIEPMTEEEELGDEYDDASVLEASTPSRPPPPKVPVPEIPLEPQENYDDCTALQVEEKEDGESSGEDYEELDEFQSKYMEEKNSSGGSKQDTESPDKTSKDSKQAEKERKQKEKEEKEKQLKEKMEKQKEEKKRKEWMKDLKNKFKTTPEELEENLGEGKIKQDVKGKGKDLAVKEGQKVLIVRMKDNPPGKWLVKLEEDHSKVGYIQESNVEVMGLPLTADFTQSPDDGEDYADADVIEAEDDDNTEGEIYEQVN